MVMTSKFLYENDKVTQVVPTHFWMKSIDLE